MIKFEQVRKDSTVEKISDKITRFVLGPYNWCTYLIQDKKNVLIDASYPVMKPLSDVKVDIIIPTHFHFDHVLFLEEIAEINNSKVYATKEACKWIKKYQRGIIPKRYSSLVNKWKSPPEIHPFITDFVMEGDIVDTGSLFLRVLETYGHFPGEISIYEEKQGILFSGDVLFDNNMYGSSRYRGGNKKLLDESVKRLESLKAKTLCPGHLL
jgi:glyoxylase-like metal-dependent hydrolase (beta-lactamase superfamily II)